MYCFRLPLAGAHHLVARPLAQRPLAPVGDVAESLLRARGRPRRALALPRGVLEEAGRRAPLAPVLRGLPHLAGAALGELFQVWSAAK